MKTREQLIETIKDLELQVYNCLEYEREEEERHGDELGAILARAEKAEDEINQLKNEKRRLMEEVLALVDRSIGICRIPGSTTPWIDVIESGLLDTYKELDDYDTLTKALGDKEEFLNTAPERQSPAERTRQ